MEILHDSTAVLNNLLISLDKMVNKRDFFQIDLFTCIRNFIGKIC